MATGAELMASATLLGKLCKDENTSYLQCKAKSGDPRDCLTEGGAVTSCGDALIARLKASVGPERRAAR